jgi:cytochrome c
MDDRGNTIAGWVLAGGIAALGLSIVTGEYFHAERPEKMGYVVEGVVEEGGEGAAGPVQPVEFYLAKADPQKGAQVFKKCAACHTDTKGGASGLGPNLWGTVGKPHAHVPGFAYSDALKGAPGNWDWKNLDAWLAAPKKYAPGTKMTFAGLSKPEDRADVIAYLNVQGDAPLPLPAAPAPSADPAAAAAEGPPKGTEAEGAQKASNEPVQTEAQAAKQPVDNVRGEGAPATSGRQADRRE